MVVLLCCQQLYRGGVGVFVTVWEDGCVVQRWCGCVCNSVEDGCVVMLYRGGVGVFVTVWRSTVMCSLW